MATHRFGVLAAEGRACEPFRRRFGFTGTRASRTAPTQQKTRPGKCVARGHDKRLLRITLRLVSETHVGNRVHWFSGGSVLTGSRALLVEMPVNPKLHTAVRRTADSSMLRCRHPASGILSPRSKFAARPSRALSPMMPARCLDGRGTS